MAKFHKKNVRRELVFNNVRRIKMFKITKNRWRIIGYGKTGEDFHLVEISIR